MTHHNTGYCVQTAAPEISLFNVVLTIFQEIVKVIVGFWTGQITMLQAAIPGNHLLSENIHKKTYVIEIYFSFGYIILTFQNNHLCFIYLAPLTVIVSFRWLFWHQWENTIRMTIKLHKNPIYFSKFLVT